MRGDGEKWGDDRYKCQRLDSKFGNVGNVSVLLQYLCLGMRNNAWIDLHMLKIKEAIRPAYCGRSECMRSLQTDYTCNNYPERPCNL